MHTPSLWIRPSGARTASFAIACLLLLAGCAGRGEIAAPPGSTDPGRSTAPAETAPSAPSSASVVIEVRLRRSAELVDARGALRVFNQDLTVEYRAGGKGPGLDAGELTLDGKPLQRTVDRKGGVSYRLGRDEPEGGTQADADPWGSIANTGGPGVAAATVRVKLAPYPVVTRPAPGQSVARTEDFPVVMLPPVADVWYRVSIVGVGDPVPAIDMGEGRWIFTRDSLAGLSAGRARLLVEVETNCGDCPGAGPMRANWSTRTELEMALTVF